MYMILHIYWWLCCRCAWLRVLPVITIYFPARVSGWLGRKNQREELQTIGHPLLYKLSLPATS